MKTYIKYIAYYHLLLLLYPFAIYAQPLSLDYFRSPMDTPMILSAPFGSLRDNHFHSGMDIRTNEKIGLPVYAVADGFISRIKYSAVGYGKAIYIDHPNGYTSVYGHLNEANGVIGAYIKRYQYEQEQFEFDHFPGKNRLPVKKGDTIGWSGNSGTSTGPHLHFEIRDTRTEEPMHPQLFGIPAVDLFAPAFKSVHLYNLKPNRPELLLSISAQGNKWIQTDSGSFYTDTLVVPAQTIGIGTEAVDFMDNNTREYSIYGLELQIDNTRYFEFKLTRFAFDDTRCVNVHIDYPSYKLQNVRYQKLFLDDGNSISLYPFKRSKGRFVFKDTSPHLFKLTCRDFSGNTSIVCVYVRSTRQDATNTAANGSNVSSIIYPRRSQNFSAPGFKAEFMPSSLYDTLYLQYSKQPMHAGLLSDIHVLPHESVPLHKGIAIAIQADSIPERLKTKLSIGTYNKSGIVRSAGGGFENGWVSCKTNQFGSFFIIADTVSPSIKPINIIAGSIADSASIKIKVEDMLSGICCYKGLINGRWVLFEYDAKNDLLEYFFDEHTPEAKLDLDLTVWDKKGNSSTYKTSIKRK
ncbi:MAG: M23 family metallopeptidase [Bacteroidota bacterium]|jgi:hypothetical protein